MLVKRSFTLSGHRTSVALEPEFWQVLEQISASNNMALSAFVAQLDASRTPALPLASSLRVAALRGALSSRLSKEPAAT